MTGKTRTSLVLEVFQKRPALKIPINSPLYIGNLADYAGYAVNNPQAKLPARHTEKQAAGQKYST